MAKSYIPKSALLLSALVLASSGQLIKADEITSDLPSDTATELVATQDQATATSSVDTATIETTVSDSTAAPTDVTSDLVTTETVATTTETPVSDSETSTTENVPVTEAITEPSTEATVAEPVEGDSVNMRILSTTDLHTNLVNYDYYQDKESQAVGLAKTAVLIKQAREENSNTVLVDSGDTIQGTPFGTYEALINPVKEGETHPMYKAFEKLGYDAETLGNHEFNYGLEFIDRMVKAANINIINANIRNAKTGENYYTPYKIIEKNFTNTDGKPVTIKIGITGVVPTQILVWDKANLEGKVIVDDPLEAVKAMVPKMKADGADFILVAAHSGIGDDQYTKNEENEGYQLAAIDGVDAVATGHSHANFPNGDGTSFYARYAGVDDVNGLINGKPVVMAGKFGDHLGIMDIQLTYKDGKWTVANSKAKLQKIDTKSTDVDQELIDMVAEEHQGTIDYVRKEVGETTAPITSYFAQVTDDPSIQIVNNAQEWYVKQQLAGTADADLPILSAAAPFKAGTRGDASYYTDIPVGPLAIKNVADLYLYDNVTAIIKLTGAQIKEWLEMSAGQFNQIDPNSTEPQQLINSNYRSYNFDVIDGLTYQFDITQPNKYDFEGNLVNPDANRVRNLQYQGKDIDPDQVFIVASNNYRATGNFPGVRDAAEKRLLNLENRQVLIDYIVSEKVINPSADNNWSFTDSIKGADLRFLSSETAQNHLADNKNITYVGASSSEGFGEYQFHYTASENQQDNKTDDQDNKASDNTSDNQNTKDSDKASDNQNTKDSDKASDNQNTKDSDKASDNQNTKDNDKSNNNQNVKSDKASNNQSSKYSTNNVQNTKANADSQLETVIYQTVAKAYQETLSHKQNQVVAATKANSKLAKAQETTLPETGSQESSTLTMIGLGMMSILGFFGLKKRRH
ncbi:bifunctional 2',3'-cyclic-nucleotide 2'-phosphodiesterase/3'-nucleotidase [Streptococcus saliviloxodontae]|uniref:2',3'-cyclic-nucleotide 2'-phosphodiesterase/3'-nucleotidase n=1 Tax=Streptococcus saliviloxodontae TaxID=1349416 RepID=A0ABS2PML8_9STRE|nr:bifunctional 2',3'-cyclic-nucleotide 2'-phosphodiesterase/3'-nucleotidase [Streptococcus saliviloxodontae]MBM7636675.1 2',3'-cyclic-nucleotide 2'-phosphodiesterase/3'-nucleotidase [Streptococcus saliviloxodontae]